MGLVLFSPCRYLFIFIFCFIFVHFVLRPPYPEGVGFRLNNSVHLLFIKNLNTSDPEQSPPFLARVTMTIPYIYVYQFHSFLHGVLSLSIGYCVKTVN